MSDTNPTPNPATPAAAEVPTDAPQPTIAYPPQPTPGIPAPQPMLESEARTWAMMTHIIAAVALFISAGTLAFVVPLIFWLMYRERSALVAWHGKQSLNLQLTALLVTIVGTVLGVVTFGLGFFLTGPAIVLFDLYVMVISVVAGVKANSGQYYRVPLAIPFIR